MSANYSARWAKIALMALGALALVGGTISTSYAADDAKMYIVQGLPGRKLDVAVDGKKVAGGLKAAAVVGPFTVKAGEREITFSDDGEVVLERTFSVKAKSSWDVVAHLPESREDKPAVTVFRNDVAPVPRGKASLVVAHTATVPPADIRVNGQVLFENIGNGESLELTVPVATYEVAIVPTGETKPVVLGPLELTVKGGAVNRVYAIGDPGQEDDERRGARHPDGQQRLGPAVRRQHRLRRRGRDPSLLSEAATVRPRDASWRARSVPCCSSAGWPAVPPRPSLEPRPPAAGRRPPGRRAGGGDRTGSVGPGRQAGPDAAGALRAGAVVLPGGARAPVQPAVTVDGQLQVPENVQHVGWWDGSAYAGDPFGRTVIAGHVDSANGSDGFFVRLKRIKQGDVVTLRAGERRLSYKITAVQVVARQALATDSQAFDQSGAHRLVLITCTGDYRRDRGGYESNLVVIGKPLGLAR